MTNHFEVDYQEGTLTWDSMINEYYKQVNKQYNQRLDKIMASGKKIFGDEIENENKLELFGKTDQDYLGDLH